MTKEEFLKLVHEYGDACFDCGEWQKDNDTDVPYETVYGHVESAKKALLEALPPKWTPFVGQPVPRPGRDEDYEERQSCIDASEECPHGVLYCDPCTSCFPPRWEKS